MMNGRMPAIRDRDIAERDVSSRIHMLTAQATAAHKHPMMSAPKVKRRKADTVNIEGFMRACYCLLRGFCQ